MYIVIETLANTKNLPWKTGSISLFYCRRGETGDKTCLFQELPLYPCHVKRLVLVYVVLMLVFLQINNII